MTPAEEADRLAMRLALGAIGLGLMWLFTLWLFWWPW